MASESGDSARAHLIRTRRGTWIDEGLLPAARRECLGVLREAARKAVGEATHLPGWISDAIDSVEGDLEDLSIKRLEWKPTPAEQKMEEEVEATIDALEERGAFEGLGLWERLEFEWHVRERIRSKHDSQIAREAEEARRKNPRPKSNPTLITEKDTLNSTLDELLRHGVLDEIMVTRNGGSTIASKEPSWRAHMPLSSDRYSATSSRRWGASSSESSRRLTYSTYTGRCRIEDSLPAPSSTPTPCCVAP